MKYLTIFFLLIFFINTTLEAQSDDFYGTPFMGVYSNGISQKKAEKLGFDNTEGSYITGIISNTAAEKAGLQAFDYIIGIDEYRADFNRSLTAILKKFDVGDEVKIHFYRNGKKQVLPIKLGKRSDAEYSKKTKKEDPFLGVEQIGKNWSDDYDGVKVNIVDNSTAAAMKLEDGDIITHINNYAILDWTDLGAAINMNKVGNKMEVTFIRDGKTRKSDATVKSLAASKYNESYSYNKSQGKKYSDKEDYGTENSKNAYSYRSASGGRNINGLKVTLANVSSKSAERFREKSELNLNSNNDLPVNNLMIEGDTDKGVFQLKFDLPSKGRTSVNIYNENGRNIYDYDLGSFSGEFEDVVDIAQNGVGTYLLKISQDGKNLTKEVKLSNN